MIEPLIYSIYLKNNTPLGDGRGDGAGIKNAPGKTGGEQLVLGKQLIATCIFERCLSISGQAQPVVQKYLLYKSW